MLDDNKILGWIRKRKIYLQEIEIITGRIILVWNDRKKIQKDPSSTFCNILVATVSLWKCDSITD